MNDRIVNYIRYHPIRTQRGLEILTGLVPWAIIISFVTGSFFIPEIIAYFIIAFNIYWLYRCLQLAFYATLGYLNIRATQKIDWQKKLPANDLWHVVIVPMVKEPLELAERNLDSLLAQSFPHKRIMVVVAMEQRA